MKNNSKLKSTRGSSTTSAQQLALVIRLSILLLVITTVWFLSSNKLSIALAVLIYLVLLFFQTYRVFKPKKNLGEDWIFTAIDLLFVSLVIYFTGGMSSPYMILIFPVVLVASLSLNFAGFIISYLLSLGLVLIIAISQMQITFTIIVLQVVTLLCGFVVLSLEASYKRYLTPSQTKKEPANLELTKLKILINSMTEAVFLIDQKGRVVLYNGAALELLDTHEDIIDKPISKVFPLADGSKKPVDLADLFLRGQKLIIRDDLIYHSGAHFINLHTTINPVVENGTLEGALVLARDISRQKTLSAQKDEFISIISHELRTPVAVVEADLSTLLVPNFVTLPDKALKLVRSAQSSLVFLQNLLQDLSELSQADRSVLDIELNEIEPVSIINEIIKDLHTKAQETGVTLKSDVAKNLPVVFSSKERLKEILVNFMTNAIKYSGQGKLVTVVARPSIKIRGGVQISIVDQGIGMSLADQKKLFTKFFRSESPATQKIKGTGMGLYISKRQADRIGATIWLQSKLGVGSTFFIEVPPKIPGEHKFTTEPK